MVVNRWWFADRQTHLCQNQAELGHQAKTNGASADDLRNIITNGKGRMPKYGGKLTSEEIDTLVQQIKALK